MESSFSLRGLSIVHLPFWPFRTLLIPTSLEPGEAIDALDRALRDGWDKELRDGRLCFSRNGWLNSNGWRPDARATAVNAPHGANVRVSLRLAPSRAIFTAVWMLGASVGAVAAIAAALTGGAARGLFVCVMPLAGLAMIAASFEPEARLIERTCRGALPSPPEPPQATGPFR